ncbi:LarC family nickel insertion protein [Skermanella mucosa]|uniref:LarC family nickel insertion protein n=1 Tax=Skermanella mucosa TaxID=1789672 RepID=UPI00192AAFA1|nr:LarC family nickel insertion protein [Skermanella mucosa]UEM21996.1 LarC family nickel insertion protein [Skermanella mucosa]
MTLRHIHLDAVGGIAGDMFVAALVDAVPVLRDRVLDDAAAVLPPRAGTPVFSTGASAGISVLRFGLEGGRDGGHDHHEGYGSYRHMAGLIREARLSEGTAGHAVAILTLLAEAEAAIHGVPVEQVHFHEIGDWDSLMDVVAAGSVAAALESTWSVSDLPLGGGRVRAAHGMLPVPAPATARLLEGFDWRDDGVSGERVTPTGAAILRHLVKGPGRPGGRLKATGSGAGTRELPGMPNILRALVFDTAAAESRNIGQEVAVLSFDVDDMTGEEIGVAADRLRALDGVLDLALAPLAGKKGRPLTGFRLLVRPDALAPVRERCLLETSTIGLRWRTERRTVLSRVSSGETVRVKRVERPGGATTAKAESDDLAGIDGLAARRACKAEAESGR